MNTQTLTKSANSLNFLFAFAESSSLLDRPITASSRDYGFDFDEAELARELLALLPALPATTQSLAAQTHDFEQALQYFFS